jgi:crotonobetainyl-CoA:carnitine CoA-transferase CaiB-like acyl-CoA transferase
MQGNGADITTTAAPLSDIKVVDLSRVLAGPYAAMLLADLGASVIKIERPDLGDDTRHWGPPFVGPADGRESTYFLSVNRNKRSVVADLKDPTDLALIRSIVDDADVVIENFRTGVMERLGLGPDVLRERNPRLVVLSITGFGSDGPDAQRAGYDMIVQAEGGMMSFTGPTRDQPTKVGVPIADLTAGIFGAMGVVSALYQRESTGVGQMVSTSLLAGQIATHSFQGTNWLVAKDVPQPSGNHHPTVSPYGVFSASDADLVIAVGNNDIWNRLAALLKLDATDGRFTTNELRIENRSVLETMLTAALGKKTADEWLAVFAANGVPAGKVRRLDEVYASAQVRQQGLVMEVDHATLGTIELAGPAIRFSASEPITHSAPPTLGQHSAEVRTEFAERELTS